MMRLSTEIDQALESDDFASAARAQREMRRVQLDKPSAACRVMIQEDCRTANALIRLGDAADMDLRIKAVRKLGRWLRWRQTAAKEMVPVATALEGLLWALRSEPDVAWTAQCALFHAARCTERAAQSVRNSTRGIISRLLLNEPTPFPLTLPRLALRTAETYERALRSGVVQDFFSQLRSLTLVDPGWGDDPEYQDLSLFLTFAKMLGRSFHDLQSLQILGFQDCALVLLLPQLILPKLQCLQITGSCQTAEAQQAILSVLARHGCNLVELELNVWTEFLCEADDPLVDIGTMPQVKRLMVRAPTPVPWEHLGRLFPALEELTFLYDQDFALNTMEVLDDCDDYEEQLAQLEQQTLWLYRDAVVFARDLHARGFSRLAKRCVHLREIRLAIADTSFGYDIAPHQERCMLHWRRQATSSGERFRRNGELNSATRAALEARQRPDEDDLEEEEEDVPFEVTEEDAAVAGAAAMLQVARLFDDPSLEAELGLRRL